MLSVAVAVLAGGRVWRSTLDNILERMAAEPQYDVRLATAQEDAFAVVMRSQLEY